MSEKDSDETDFSGEDKDGMLCDAKNDIRNLNVVKESLPDNDRQRDISAVSDVVSDDGVGILAECVTVPPRTKGMSNYPSIVFILILIFFVFFLY